MNATTNFARNLRTAMRQLTLISLLAAVLISGFGFAGATHVFAAPNGATYDATSYITDMTAAGHFYSFIATTTGESCNGAYILVPVPNRVDQKITVPMVGNTMVTYAKGEWSAKSVDVATAVTYTDVSGQRYATIDTNDQLSGGFEIRYCSDVQTRERYGVGTNTPAVEAAVEWEAYDEMGQLRYTVPLGGGKFDGPYYGSFKLAADGTTLSNIDIFANSSVSFFQGYQDSDGKWVKVVDYGTCTSTCTLTAPANTTFMSQGFGPYIQVEINATDPNHVFSDGESLGVWMP